MKIYLFHRKVKLNFRLVAFSAPLNRQSWQLCSVTKLKKHFLNIWSLGLGSMFMRTVCAPRFIRAWGWAPDMSWLTRDIWLIWLHTLYLAILNNLPLYDILRIWFIKQYEMQNDCLHGIFDHVGSSYYEQNLCLQMILLVAWSRICRLIMCQHQILSK